MANYIHQLQDELAYKTAALDAILEGIASIETYLNLPKFYPDTTVQRSDIFLRLEETRSQATDAACSKMVECSLLRKGGA